MTHDRPNERSATGDQNAQHTDLFAANRDGATRAFQDQLNTAMFGFLNGADTALGGKGDARPKDPEPIADATKQQKGDVQFQAMATLGLTDISQSHNTGEAGERVAEQQRMIAFESIYASATSRDNHSGFNNTRDGGTTLKFTGPQLDTTSKQQLTFA